MKEVRNAGLIALMTSAFLPEEPSMPRGQGKWGRDTKKKPATNRDKIKAARKQAQKTRRQK